LSGVNIQIIEGKKKDLGEFSVERILPSRIRQMVGPYIFFDVMGPARFSPGQGVNVRPHPHIGLMTMTYLVEGSILHRDSLGFEQEILPGDMNLMIAGRGIVHSERETKEVREQEHSLYGIQLWLALPDGSEEVDPQFYHFKEKELPTWKDGGIQRRLIAGEAYGQKAPAPTYSPLFYVEVHFQEEASKGLELPNPEHELALFVLQGKVKAGESDLKEGSFYYFEPRDRPLVNAEKGARILLLGGEKFTTPRYMEWNFVSSSKERIEEAKKAWSQGEFPTVVGDEEEFIPYP